MLLMLSWNQSKMIRTIHLIMDQIQMYLKVTQKCMITFQTHRLELKANQIMIINHMLMTTKRAKSINIGKINANIAKSQFPKWDTGKFKAKMACSIPTMGHPFMRPTFWPGLSMVRLLVGPRVEQFCNN